MTLLIDKYKYNQLPRNDDTPGGRTYETPEGINVPSVTTVLSATSDTSGLDQWRKRIGHKEAAFITKLSSDIGTQMHDNLEEYFYGRPMAKGTSQVKKTGRELAEIIVGKIEPHISEIWGLEAKLHYPGLYAGTADVIGLWKGEPAIMDFKNSRRPKKMEYIKNYYLQITAYAMAHNELYGTDIKKGVIFIACREAECYGEYQEFDVDIDEYRDKWLTTLEDYYNQL